MFVYGPISRRAGLPKRYAGVFGVNSAYCVTRRGSIEVDRWADHGPKAPLLGRSHDAPAALGGGLAVCLFSRGHSRRQQLETRLRRCIEETEWRGGIHDSVWACDRDRRGAHTVRSREAGGLAQRGDDRTTARPAEWKPSFGRGHRQSMPSRGVDGGWWMDAKDGGADCSKGKVVDAIAGTCGRGSARLERRATPPGPFPPASAVSTGYPRVLRWDGRCATPIGRDGRDGYLTYNASSPPLWTPVPNAPSTIGWPVRQATAKASVSRLHPIHKLGVPCQAARNLVVPTLPCPVYPVPVQWNGWIADRLPCYRIPRPPFITVLALHGDCPQGPRTHLLTVTSPIGQQVRLPFSRDGTA